MSMMSNRCDKLRNMAEQTDWEIPEAAMLMRDAADTISELCENVQGWRRLAIEQEVKRVEQIRAVERESAELRELVRASWRCIHTGLSCSDCRIVAGGCTLESAMRELGVEVEG